jgi:ATP/maltotriose-dependent transcriptional regulator MalT
MGEKGARAVVAAYLGEFLSRRGRDDEAASFAEIAATLAAADDLVPQVLCRSVRAKVLARRGKLDQAEELAREAAAMVESTDFPDLQALTLLSLAEVLESTAKTEESARLIDRAQEIYEKKGNIVAGTRMVREFNTDGRPR